MLQCCNNDLEVASCAQKRAAMRPRLKSDHDQIIPVSQYTFVLSCTDIRVSVSELSCIQCLSRLRRDAHSYNSIVTVVMDYPKARTLIIIRQKEDANRQTGSIRYTMQFNDRFRTIERPTIQNPFALLHPSRPRPRPRPSSRQCRTNACM